MTRMDPILGLLNGQPKSKETQLSVKAKLDRFSLKAFHSQITSLKPKVKRKKKNKNKKEEKGKEKEKEPNTQIDS